MLGLTVPGEAGHSFVNPAKLHPVASGVNPAASLQGTDSDSTKYITAKVLLNSLPL